MTSASATDPAARLDAAFRDAIRRALGEAFAGVDPVIRASQNRRFGDYQSNVAMGLARRLGANPRVVAARLVEALELAGLTEPPEVAGPGFINLRLRNSALEELLAEMSGPALGVEPDPDPHPVVIDMCSVNVAKQMHVGHLRSTIIGDALARVFERCGRTVHRENHLGDWGLPIAMVLHDLRAREVNLDTLCLADLDEAYRQAQLAARADPRGLEAARRLGAGPHRLIELEEQNAGAAEATAAAKETLVALQGGAEELDRDWRRLIACTLRALDEALEILGVRLGPENNRGESFYRDRLPGVVESFLRAGVAEEDQGALVVRFSDRQRPMLIRKSDGGYLYATTDLAAVRHRAGELGANLIIYVVDARQRAHFRDVFDAVRRVGWDRTADGVAAALVHVPFGSVLGPDRKPLKTRSGQNLTLRSLLEEACARGRREVEARAADPAAPTHGLDGPARARIGRAVGVGAIKYADLSSDLVRDYVFDLDRMIAFEGHTGPYLQYAHARVCSIFARADLDGGGEGPHGAAAGPGAFLVREPAERQLALILVRYGAVVGEVACTFEPHRLCAYLYDLAGAYSGFYQACPVLRAGDEAVRAARLALCDLTRRVLADGLDLLGIDAPQRM